MTPNATMPAREFPRVTASKLDLLAQCVGSHALPWVKDTSDAGEIGRAKHEFLERALGGDLDGAFAKAPAEVLAWAETIDVAGVARLFSGEVFLEEAFAYNPIEDTSRSLGAGTQRNYSAAPADRMIAGTVDANGETGERVTVADWKTGRSWIQHPRSHWQVKFAAIAKARAVGAKNARGVIGRIDADGVVHAMWEDWDELSLDAIAEEFRQLWEKLAAARATVLAGGTPPLTAGPMCRYCPAFSACPAPAGAAQALVQIGERVPALTPETAAKMWELAKAVRAALDRVDATLEAYAVENPFELPGGSVVRLEKTTRNEIDPQIAVKVLAVILGPVAASAAIKLSVSQEAIGDALKAAGVTRRKAKTIKEIGAAGGLKPTTFESVKEVFPKEIR